MFFWKWNFRSYYLPVGKKAITYKWVFKVKLKANGTLKRYKARLVTKGFLQIEVLYYGETISFVIKPTTIHVVLNLALSRGCLIR